MKGGIVFPGETDSRFTTGCKQKMFFFMYMVQSKYTHMKLTPITELFYSAKHGYRICTSKVRRIYFGNQWAAYGEYLSMSVGEGVFRACASKQAGVMSSTRGECFPPRPRPHDH